MNMLTLDEAEREYGVKRSTLCRGAKSGPTEAPSVETVPETRQESGRNPEKVKQA